MFNLKLSRWQLWLLLILALWMIYSGITKLNRERKPQEGQSFSAPVMVLHLEETVNG